MEAILFIRFLNKLKDFLKKFDLDGVTNSVAVDKVWCGSGWAATLVNLFSQISIFNIRLFTGFVNIRFLDSDFLTFLQKLNIWYHAAQGFE